MNSELDNYKFPNNSVDTQDDRECPSPGTSPTQPTLQIPLRSAMSNSDRAFLRATGQQPSTSTTKTIPACFNSLNVYQAVDNRRKSVDVGGLARSNKEAKDGLGELIGDLFKKSKHLNEEEEEEESNLQDKVSQDTIDIPNKDHLIHKLSTWGFQPLTLNNDDLFNCAVIILESGLQLPSLRHLSLSQFIPFLIAVRKSYSAPNAYHNYTHAIDVLQATYSFLVMLNVAPPIDSLTTKEPWSRSENGLASKLLSDWDILSLLISAIGHDVGHPGLNNTFMNNAQTPLSEIYQSKSVLENMHCILLVQLLRKHNLGFLIGASSNSSLTPFDVINMTESQYESHTEKDDANAMKRASAKVESEATAMATATPNSPSTPTTPTNDTDSTPRGTAHDAKKFRNLMSKTVLATDMSLHFDFMKMLSDMRERMLNGKDSNEGLDRTLLLQALIKCADISNPARPYHVCEHWSKALLEEWAKQAALETQLSLPVTVFSSADPVSQAKSQVGFIDMFVQPLFQVLADFLPELNGVLEHCQKNRERWLKKSEKQASPPQPTQPSPLVMSRNVSVSSQGGGISGISSHRSSLSGATPHHMFGSCCAGSSPMMSPSAEINLQFGRRSSSSKPIPIPRRSSSISTDDSNIMRQTESKIVDDISKPSSTAPASTQCVTAFDPRFRQLFPLSLPQALAVSNNEGEDAESGEQNHGGQSRSISPGPRHSYYRVSWPASPYSNC